MKKRVIVLLSLGALPLQLHADEHQDDWPAPMHEYYFGQVLFDRLEVIRTSDGDTNGTWDLNAWYGGDYHRAVFKSEGEAVQNDGNPTELESAELLYSYLLTPYWSVQAGIGTRGELSSESSMENYVVFSFSGLAPYWFEMDNALIINDEGDLQITSEAEYEWQLTQTSYLQPSIEITANVTDSSAYQREAGFSHIRVGLRYRQEVTREFAPYIGVQWSKMLGNNADQARQMGDDTSEIGFIAGVRMWF